MTIDLHHAIADNCRLARWNMSLQVNVADAVTLDGGKKPPAGLQPAVPIRVRLSIYTALAAMVKAGYSLDEGLIRLSETRLRDGQQPFAGIVERVIRFQKQAPGQDCLGSALIAAWGSVLPAERTLLLVIDKPNLSLSTLATPILDGISQLMRDELLP